MAEFICNLITLFTGLTSVQTVGYMLESFALLYHEIDDHSLSFAQFIEMMTERGGPQSIEDCFALFENCGNEEIYQMYSMWRNISIDD